MNGFNACAWLTCGLPAKIRAKLRVNGQNDLLSGLLFQAISFFSSHSPCRCCGLSADKQTPVKHPLRFSPCSLLGRGTISPSLTPCSETSGVAVVSGEDVIPFVTLFATTQLDRPPRIRGTVVSKWGIPTTTM